MQLKGGKRLSISVLRHITLLNRLKTTSEPFVLFESIFEMRVLPLPITLFLKNYLFMFFNLQFQIAR